MRIPARRVPPPLRARNLRRAWTRLGDARALLAGGAVLGGASALGASQVAMISVMAYRMFCRPRDERGPVSDRTYAIAHRVAKHLLVTSGRSIAAVTIAETAASVYLGLRVLRDNVSRMRPRPLLLPAPREVKEEP